MSIQEHLNKIRNAIYGKEVRESIAKGIETAYNDASEKDNANMEVKIARGTHPNLRSRLDETTAQLAQTGEEISALGTSVNGALSNKVDKGGNEQITWGMLNQSVKTNITGGNTAVVGTNSVNTTNLVNKSVTSEKRTVLGDLPVLTTGTNGGDIDFDLDEMNITFSGTFHMTIRNVRYSIPAGTVIDLTSVESTGRAVFYDIGTGLFTVIEHHRLGYLQEKENKILFAIAYNRGGSWELDINFDHTVNGMPVFQKHSHLGDTFTIYPSASGGNINLVRSSLIIEFNGGFFITHRNIRYTISDGTTIDLSSLSNETAIVIYFDTLTNEFEFESHTRLYQVKDPERKFLFAVAYRQSGNNEWFLDANFDYMIDGIPSNLVKENKVDYRPHYEFSPEGIGGTFPEGSLIGVGNEANPFYGIYENGHDHNIVYDLFDGLMAKYPEYITRELEGNSTNGLPIYSYHFRPVRADYTFPDSDLKPYPKIIMDSSIHGNEGMGTITLCHLFERICEEWESSETLRYLRHFVNFSIIPLPNPEDYNSEAYNGTPETGDKNLNRDFGGDEPFTRVESQIMRDFLHKHDDALMFINCHVIENGVSSYNHLMWLSAGPSSPEYNPIMATTIEGMSSRWRKKYEVFNDVVGPLGFIAGGGGTSSPTVRSFAQYTVGIPSLLWEGFNTNQSFPRESDDALNMHVEYLGSLVVNVLKYHKMHY